MFGFEALWHRKQLLLSVLGIGKISNINSHLWIAPPSLKISEVRTIFYTLADWL